MAFRTTGFSLYFFARSKPICAWVESHLQMQTVSLPDPFYLIALLVLLSLAPFMAIMVTSFIKIVVVLSLVRNALGIQQIPPNMVINGMAIILTLYIMAPVGQEVFEILQQEKITNKDYSTVRQAADRAKEPTMAKKDIRKIVILECTEAPGTSVYTTVKNPRNTPDRLQLKKYNPTLRKHTLHKEKK